jgi:hypothetical protein
MPWKRGPNLTFVDIPQFDGSVITAAGQRFAVAGNGEGADEGAVFRQATEQFSPRR